MLPVHSARLKAHRSALHYESEQPAARSVTRILCLGQLVTLVMCDV